MADQYPSQIRTVDPFASYNSDTVNKLTRMITNGDDYLFSPKAIDVISDTTAPTTHVVVTEGSAFKDDVWIQITAEHRVDFENSDFYVSFGGGFNEAGYYYVTLDYEYAKSRPAPRAAIKIFKPSQQSLLTERYLFLKAVNVIFNGSTFEISSLHDYDPGDPTVKRENTPVWAGVENTLPTFNSDTDWGKIIYVRDTDSFYFGLIDRWQSVIAEGVRINVDTTGVDIGQLIYVDSNTVAQLANSSAVATMAVAIVTQVGLASNGTGKARILGKVENVYVETGVTITAGEPLYLSDLDSGSVTNVATYPLYQYVGVALTGATGPNTIDMLFYPGQPTIDAPFKYITTTGTTAGDLVYLKSDGTTDLALADGSKYAIGAVLMVGTEANKTGSVRLAGEVDNVPIENTISISVGDQLYLSENDDGRVTNVAPEPYYQPVGNALESGVGNVGGTVRIKILLRIDNGQFRPSTDAGVVTETIATGDWNTYIGGVYYDVFWFK
jgi:predicted RecA/RadA family phage recombinase